MGDLVLVNNPLDRSDQTRIDLITPAGTTLAQAVEQAAAHLPAVRYSSLAVSVDGAVYRPEQWGQVMLLPESQVVIIPVLHDAGGEKDIIRMVAMVVVAVVATIVSYGISSSGAWGLVAANSGAAYGMAAGAAAAITLAGNLIINAVIPPSRPQIPALNGYAGLEQSNSYSWNPTTTQQQGTVIPWAYGTCKLTGNVIATWREAVGNKHYLNLLISLGEGPLANIYDIRINDQPVTLDSFPGIAIETRLGLLNQDVIPGFNDTKIEYPLGSRVLNDSPVYYTTIGSAFDALEIELSFLQGLGYYNNYGDLAALSVNFRIEYRLQGAAEWAVLTTQPATVRVSDGGYWSAGYWNTNGYYLNENDYVQETVWVQHANGGADPNSHYEGETYNNGSVWRWIGAPIRIVDITNDYVTVSAAQTGSRSEERRVGKEGSSRWSPAH